MYTIVTINMYAVYVDKVRGTGEGGRVRVGEEGDVRE